MAIEPKTQTTTAKPIIGAASATIAKEKNPHRLRDTTSNFLWTVVGLKDCEWTDKTVNLLKEHGEQVKYIELNAEWQRRIVVEYGTRRIPAIFKGSSYFGSYDVLENYYKCSFISDSERF
jgi:glutaredoxin